MQTHWTAPCGNEHSKFITKKHIQLLAMHLGFNEIAVFGGVHKYIRPSLCNFGQRIIRQSSHLLHLGWWWYLTGSHRGRNWIAGVEFNAHLSVLERSWDKWWLLFIRLWKGKIAIYKFYVWTRIDIAAARLTHKMFTTSTVFDGALVCVFRVVCNIWYVFLVSDLLCNAPPHIQFRYDTAHWPFSCQRHDVGCGDVSEART